MKTFILSLALVFSCLAMQAQQLTHPINLATNDVGIDRSENYDMVTLPGADHLSGREDAGKPALPVMHINLLLPAGAVAQSVNLTGAQTQIPGTFNIAPAQLPWYPNFEEPPAFVDPDPSVYSSNSPFPQNPILGYSFHQFREYSYVSIRFVPFFPQPESGQIKILTFQEPVI